MRKFRRLIRLPVGRRHRAFVRLCARALKDDRGGEVLEYALIAGLIVVAAIGMISCVGMKVTGKWTSVNTKM